MRKEKWRFGLVTVVEGENGDYIVSGDICTCWAGLAGRNCIHKKVVGNMPIDLKSATKSLKYFASSLKGLNDLYGGYLYNSDEIVCLYGKPMVGKTLFSLQEAFGVGKNVLYIDTEGGFRGMAAKWADVFEQRFNSKSDIYLESCRTLNSLHEFMGFKTQIVFKKSKDDEDDEEDKNEKLDKYRDVNDLLKKKQREEKREQKEKGKMEFRILERMNYAPIDAHIEDKKIEFVIVDSVSAPVRLAIPDERQNFPARATAVGLIMGKLVELQQRHNIGVLITAHATFDPTSPYETFAELRGGIVVHHFAKRILYIDAREKKDLRDYRRFWVVRIEDSPRFCSVVGAKIDDLGFHDEKDVKRLLTENEARMVE